MDIRFYQDLLKKLGTKVTCQKMLFFFAWRDGESSKSTYNPFATTQKDTDNEGCYYNCLKSGVGYKPTGCRTCPTGTNPGVRNYKTYSSGLDATFKTLTNGRYSKVVKKLKNDNITALEIASEKAELKIWGTGGLVSDILKYNDTIRVNKIEKYGGGSIVDSECVLTTAEYNFYKQHIKNEKDGDAFREWVNSDNTRLNYVNRKLADCDKNTGLDREGELNGYIEIAFKHKGKEWVRLGKPNKESGNVVVDSKKDEEIEQPIKGESITKPSNARLTSLPQESRWGRQHHGYDIVGPYSGKKCLIVCNNPGVVTHAGRCGGYGNLVEIEHDNGKFSAYAHLYKISVTKGQQINVGDVIGIEGNTGGSMGRHLHFEERVRRPKNIKNRCGGGSPYNEVYGYDTVKPVSNLDNYFYFQQGV